MTAFAGDFESRISQLSLWVELCYTKKISFSLKISGFDSGFSDTRQHYLNCMEKLALLDESEDRA
jgi:hypothetical protein